MFPTLIIDFDSTFITLEGLEELANIALLDNPEREHILQRMHHITDQGMNGEIPFSASLSQRLQLFQTDKQAIQKLVQLLQNHITPSIQEHQAWIKQHAKHIHIISGGFVERIEPVVRAYGITPDHIYANTFLFNEEGNIIGLDTDNPLAQDQGKVKTLQNLNMTGEKWMIGDGYTDYEPRKHQLADRFIAFTENVKREQVVALADATASNFGDIIAHFPTQPLPHAILLEGIHHNAVDRLTRRGYSTQHYTTAWSAGDLDNMDDKTQIIGIRSKTKITKQVIEEHPHLQAIGCFCIGTNQTDLTAATQAGICVFNSPFGNTRSVAELTVGEIIMLMRGVQAKSFAAHRQEWKKSATGSAEVKGKTLGIVGYGNIGSQVSILAEQLGLNVLYYDIVPKLALGHARPVNSLQELMNKSDIVTLHVPGGSSTNHLIGKEEIMQMQAGSYLINNSRGTVVDITAVQQALDIGHLAGAAFDVYPREPRSQDETFEFALQGYENVILTPHIGGSTQEAQAKIGKEVAYYLTQYIEQGDTTTSVNYPQLTIREKKPGTTRITHLHDNSPGVLAQINKCCAQHSINISAQSLKTQDQYGYVVLDIDVTSDNVSEKFIQELNTIPGTIRTRIL